MSFFCVTVSSCSRDFNPLVVVVGSPLSLSALNNILLAAFVININISYILMYSQQVSFVFLLLSVYGKDDAPRSDCHPAVVYVPFLEYPPSIKGKVKGPTRYVRIYRKSFDLRHSLTDRQLDNGFHPTFIVVYFSPSLSVTGGKE